MINTILVDKEEKQKRLDRRARFGANDEEYIKTITKDKSLKWTPDDIVPKNPAASYKLDFTYLPSPPPGRQGGEGGQETNISNPDETERNPQEQPAPKGEEDAPTPTTTAPANPEITLDKKQLMLFGVTLMNTEDIEKYFNTAEIKVKKIFWLNDFTCWIEFDTAEIALKAYAEYTGSSYNPERSEIDNYNWKSARKYTKWNHEMDIEIRVAQVGDTTRKSARKESVYYKWYSDRYNVTRGWRRQQKQNQKSDGYGYLGRGNGYGRKGNSRYSRRERSRDKY